MIDTVCAICNEPYTGPIDLLMHPIDYHHRFVPAAPKVKVEHDDSMAASDWDDDDLGWGE